MTIVLSPAKINLHLHVTGKTDNNYHLLDSLVAFTAFGDRIEISPADRYDLVLSGPFAPGIDVDDRNLVTRAMRALEQEAGRPLPYNIHIEKNIPAGGGLGGGSSNAATVIREIAKAENLADLDLSVITSRLGSDITAFLYAPQPIIMRGTGNDISVDVPEFPPCPVLLAHAGSACATPQVYRTLAMDKFSSSIAFPKQFRGLQDFVDFLDRETRNDLTAPALQIETSISETLEALSILDGCLFARMSGSGATCFGLFTSNADAYAAQMQITKAHPEWWSVVTTTL